MHLVESGKNIIKTAKEEYILSNYVFYDKISKIQMSIFSIKLLTENKILLCLTAFVNICIELKELIFFFHKYMANN